ncbi:hypothetical protein DPMN_027627 [Dreissena polymorpha]|uniref:Uncharacterized protein n=1 Tax=Dreissena polymorpha TaxID=45954 RepID=A0A9D4LTB1_DREPO|nr:hypothetical protein DPMN_027627 [Dreissena polymorpha]
MNRWSGVPGRSTGCLPDKKGLNPGTGEGWLYMCGGGGPPCQPGTRCGGGPRGGHTAGMEAVVCITRGCRIKCSQ